MFKTIAAAFKDPQIRKGIIITLVLLLVYRLGCYLPIPGIDTSVYSSRINQDGLGVLGLLNAVSGSALANGSFLALSVTPYINASIIVQLLTVAIPPLERMSKEGDEGQKKIQKITKYVALVLAVAQAIGVVLGFGTSSLEAGLFGKNTASWVVATYVVVMMIAGSCFTMWLGDRISDQKIGNGVSLIIFVGIISSAGLAIVNVFGKIIDGNTKAIWELIAFLAFALLVFVLIVFVDLAERKIPVQYAKQVKGRKMYGGQNSFIPMKVNAGGVMPIIFATAIITFPSIIMQIAGVESGDGWFAKFYYDYLGSGGWIYSILVGLLILFFSYFYAQIMFNPVDVSNNIQQHGGFIPGIRAGKPTAEYLSKVQKRITLFGAIFLAFIAIVPSLIFKAVAGESSELINAFTATGMLIVVSVAIEFGTALESQLMMKRHKNIL